VRRQAHRHAKQRLAEANLILDYASNLADGVIDGTVTLDAAHHQATERKRATDSNTSRAHRAQRPGSRPRQDGIDSGV